jgi:Domain of unknown function (DUF1877)
MSMNATFVQLEPPELSRLQADPSLAETIFQDGPPVPPVFAKLAKTMQDRVRAAGPQFLAGTLERLDPRIRQRLEERLGHTTSDLAGGAGGDAILKLMEQGSSRGRGLWAEPGTRPVLSLDKAWHGVHYVLCGEVQPGEALLSQAVMGGIELGEDDEGFSGYGPARYFTPAQVTALSRDLSRPELEQEAAARFDAARMSELEIYPGWRASDAEWVMDAFRRLRDFYLDAAANGRAIVTCLV